ncbi:hypothetical protein AXG93_4515s1010 [Marchantia polymorpha subsp. ruderalis]|uniref:Uncharacterized protein n=1 Tax=Marchantia polymorpha subsp. ruderalis TaxID=1480154 RepID=A0A176VHJ4_MARPO|nr:hypothetical protein AXG93_4515s1010 [Marchantia polymorpha subsp. ruderalis]
MDGDADLSQREVPTAPIRRRANNEPARAKQKARKLVLPADNNADIGRAAITRNSPSSEEDMSAEVLERSTDLPAPKARRPLGHRGRHAATATMSAMKRCLPSEQVPFDDSPSGQGPSTQVPLAQERFREEPSAQKPLDQVAAGEGRDGKTRVPSAQAPSAVAVRAGVAGLLGADSPTPLEVLAGHGVGAAAEEAARPSARESPRISAATEILETEDDTQVVPLLRYLDRKAIKGARAADADVREE